jgi:putative RecB family exonuclease
VRPKKPRLSPSKITTYLACPIMYRWTYVDDRGKWYLRAKSYYSFGTTLHRVLERFHDSGDVGVETTAQALAAYEESWIEAGFVSGEDMAQAYGEGQAMIESYVDLALKRPVSARTLYTEKLFKRDMGPFVLIGRPDRVDEHEDGTIEVVDYKTGRDHVTQEDVATDIALGCYALLMREEHPDRPVVLTLHALRSGESASYRPSEEELAELESDVRFIGGQMLGHDYEFLTPVYKRLCVGCDFVPLCRKHPDYEEAAFLDAEPELS